MGMDDHALDRYVEIMKAIYKTRHLPGIIVVA
jgi:GH15 family glucan-1,4-alpha-glucosidase